MRLRNKADVIDEYAQACVDDMDMDTLIQIAYDDICDRLEASFDIEIIDEIEQSVYNNITMEIENNE